MWAASRSTLVAGLAVLAGSLPVLSVAVAQQVDATATTVVNGRRDVRDGELATEVPAYLLVSLRASALRSGPVRDGEVVLSLWGRLTGGDPRDGRVVTGDVDLGYVGATVIPGRLSARAGRQFITGGAVRSAQIDGLTVTGRIVDGVGLTAYGGAPVAPRFGAARGDALGGGRLFWRRSWDSEAGASFVQVMDHGRLERQDLGVDAWQSLPWHTIAGASFYWSLPERRLSEGELSLGWYGRRLQLFVDAQRTAPDLFLSRLSILSVFSQERHDEAGIEASLRLGPTVRLTGDYHFIDGEEGSGGRARLRAVSALGPAGLMTVGAEGRYLDVPDAGYVGGRVFAIVRPRPPLALTADADGVHFLHQVNRQTRSMVLALTAAYQIAPGWLAMVAASGGQTPFYERRIDVTGRLAYTFHTSTEKTRP
jgi:hypothetical protein